MASKKKNRPRRPIAAAPRPVDPLARIKRADEAVDQADRDLHDAIDAARDAGRTWTEIGQVLGVSRQAIQQRHATLRKRQPSSPPQASAPS